MKKLYPCMLCEKRFAEIEQAEVCEQSHAAQPKPVNLMDALRRALDAREASERRKALETAGRADRVE